MKKTGLYCFTLFQFWVNFRSPIVQEQFTNKKTTNCTTLTAAFKLQVTKLSCKQINKSMSQDKKFHQAIRYHRSLFTSHAIYVILCVGEKPGGFSIFPIINSVTPAVRYDTILYLSWNSASLNNSLTGSPQIKTYVVKNTNEKYKINEKSRYNYDEISIHLSFVINILNNKRTIPLNLAEFPLISSDITRDFAGYYC